MGPCAGLRVAVASKQPHCHSGFRGELPGHRRPSCRAAPASAHCSRGQSGSSPGPVCPAASGPRVPGGWSPAWPGMHPRRGLPPGAGVPRGPSESPRSQGPARAGGRWERAHLFDQPRRPGLPLRIFPGHVLSPGPSLEHQAPGCSGHFPPPLLRGQAAFNLSLLTFHFTGAFFPSSRPVPHPPPPAFRPDPRSSVTLRSRKSDCPEA